MEFWSTSHRSFSQPALRLGTHLTDALLDPVLTQPTRHMHPAQEIKRQHERAIAIVQQQAEMEVENLRKASTSENVLAKLVEQVTWMLFFVVV